MMANHKKPPLLGIPPSIKITDLAARHGFKPKSEEEKRATRDKLKLELATESLNVTAPNSRSGLRHDTEVDDSWASLLEDVDRMEAGLGSVRSRTRNGTPDTAETGHPVRGTSRHAGEALVQGRSGQPVPQAL